MKTIMRYTKDTMKLFLLFILCTTLFYFGLRAMEVEYQNYHRYDPPEGKAVKVMQQEQHDWINRLSIFFRIGE
ncbi:YqzK family protein [Paraliobacillus sediminis]|uniref:YqzK family protein n=1 Tax=Paraliobacillus sediminis TaxID=1885916 RepID=UPI000E3D1C6E|nr:YqzK family protein [Paraliobacillus sediminis]